jgi:hypothetical protein
MKEAIDAAIAALRESPDEGFKDGVLTEFLRRHKVQMSSQLEPLQLPPIEGPPFPQALTIKFRQHVTIQHERCQNPQCCPPLKTF